MENHLSTPPGEMLTLPRAFLSLEGDALRVYIFLLRQGGEWKGIFSLAKECEMSRRKLKQIIDNMEEQGLVEQCLNKNRTNFSLTIRTISSLSVQKVSKICTSQEKETEEKESFPPAPPIKEKEYKEKEEREKMSKRDVDQ